MAAITNFKDRITDLAGTLITADDNAITQFVLDGCYDTIDKLKKSNQFDPMEFVSAATAITDANGLDIDNIREIHYVERDSLPCRRIPHNQKSFAANSNSLYQATANDPVMYTFNNQLFILPPPTAAATGIVYHIPEYTITNFSSSTSSIDKFPNQYYEHALLYATYMTLGRQLLDLTEDVSSNSLSMDVIRKMFNEDTPDATGDVFDLLIDEDTEMVQSTLQAVQGAVAVTREKYQWYKDKMNFLKGEYMMKFSIGGKE